MTKLLQLDFVRNAAIQLAYTAPWIPLFWYLTDTLDAKTCSRKLIDRMEFCLHYHVASSAFILVLALLKYHAHAYNIDAKKHFERTGVKVMTIVQSVCAWLALIGLTMGLKENCSENIRAILYFYVVCQLVVIILPFVKLLFSLGKKKSQTKTTAEEKTEDPVTKKRLKNKAA